MAGLVHLQRIDRRLAVLGRDDNQRRVVQTLQLQSLDHAPKCIVRLQQPVRARSVEIPARLFVNGRVGVRRAASIFVVGRQFLPNAYCLEIHAEYCRHMCRFAIVRQAVNFVENCVHFELIILYGANNTNSCVEAVVIGDFRREKVVDSVARWTVCDVIGGMLICPRGASTGRAHNFEDRVRAHRFMRKQAHALAVHQMVGERARIKHVERDRWSPGVFVRRFVEHHHVARLPRAGGIRWVEDFAVVADVVEKAMANRRAASDEREQSRKRVRVCRGAGV